MKTGGGTMSHQAWLERKDRQKREEIARDAAKMKREQQEKENRAAGNNALKFSKWLAVKDKMNALSVCWAASTQVSKQRRCQIACAQCRPEGNRRCVRSGLRSSFYIERTSLGRSVF